MERLETLRLMIEWGADEGLEEHPVDRLASLRPGLGARLPPLAESPRAPQPATTAPQAAISSVTGPVQRAERLAAAAQTVEELRAALMEFDGCTLSATATNLVFVDGNPAARLMFIGEAPGAEEDRAGKPFVGASGRFLDRMLASIGLRRETDFLITNLIPWRPPGNRNPTDTEVALCLPFLHRHIALVQPANVVLLGALASRALLNSSRGIRQLRGTWTGLSVPGLAAPVPTLPMLHPAYLLRQPGEKRAAWTDLLALRRRLDGR